MHPHVPRFAKTGSCSLRKLTARPVFPGCKGQHVFVWETEQPLCLGDNPDCPTWTEIRAPCIGVLLVTRVFS